jgi:hypothetical protein
MHLFLVLFFFESANLMFAKQSFQPFFWRGENWLARVHAKTQSNEGAEV